MQKFLKDDPPFQTKAYFQFSPIVKNIIEEMIITINQRITVR